MTGPQSRWDGQETTELARAWGVPQIEAWDSIGSTNDRLAELARAGAEDWTVVVADEQTAGRGRRGDAWHSGAGAGLWMSLLVPSSGQAAAPDPRLTLIVGAATALAIESAVPGASVGIKWPNDLILGSGKLGGVLCEVCGSRVVVGIGINLRPPKDGFSAEIAGLAATLEGVPGNAVARSELGGLVIEQIRRLTSAADPWSVTTSALESRDALRGRAVETEQEGPVIAAGIDDSGALLVERRDGMRVRVVSGSVRRVDPA